MSAIPLNKETVKQVDMETGLTEREQMIYEMIIKNQKNSGDDIAGAVRLDVTRRTVLSDVQEIKKKVFLVYDKREGLWKLQ